MAFPVEDYIPETLSHWDQRLMQAVNTRHVSARVRFEFCEGRAEAAFFPGKRPAPDRKADLAFAWGRLFLGVVFNDETGFFSLLGTDDHQSPLFETDPRTLPRPVMMALAEAVFQPVCAYLSGITGQAVQIASPGAGAEFASSGTAGTGEEAQKYAVLDFAFTPDGGNTATGHKDRISGLLYLPCDPAFFEALESGLSGYPARLLALSAVDEIPVTAAFGIGEMTAGAGDLKALETGDILVPDTWFPENDGGRLMIPPFSFRYSPEKGGGEGRGQNNRSVNHVLLLEKGVKRVDEAIERTKKDIKRTMTDIDRTMKDIEDLEVRVTFEVDRRMMTVGEIRTLAEGGIIPMGKLSRKGVVVDITAGGRCFAKGKVVSLGETLGVQVTAAGPYTTDLPRQDSTEENASGEKAAKAAGEN